VETPESPREGNAARLGRAADAYGLTAARWAGRGDAERGLGVLALGFAAAYFIVLFLPWVTGSISGWTFHTSDEAGLLALAVVLVELLRLTGIWTARGADLAGFCLTAAAGIMGVTTWAVLQWASGPVEGSAFAYGYWLGFIVALVLIAVAALRLAVLSRSVP
jgi:hypothetical protein